MGFYVWDLDGGTRRRTACDVCWASVDLPVSPTVDDQTKFQQSRHVCVGVAVPWGAGPMEYERLFQSVRRLLGGLSEGVRCDGDVQLELLRIHHAIGVLLP